MRTTIRLDDDLLAKAKRQAADTGRTLNALFEDALRESLARRETPTKIKPIRLITFKGEGVRAGVDLDDNASLLDMMGS